MILVCCSISQNEHFRQTIIEPALSRLNSKQLARFPISECGLLAPSLSQDPKPSVPLNGDDKDSDRRAKRNLGCLTAKNVEGMLPPAGGRKTHKILVHSPARFLSAVSTNQRGSQVGGELRNAKTFHWRNGRSNDRAG